MKYFLQNMREAEHEVLPAKHERSNPHDRCLLVIHYAVTCFYMMSHMHYLKMKADNGRNTSVQRNGMRKHM